jgi:predicted O-methyltransferase YrrM
LAGYSSSWMCRAIEKQQGAHLDCLELNPTYAKIAEENLAPWKKIVTVHTGPALETLETKLSALKDLDFVFIDADKISYPEYFEWSWSRIRKGGMILIDNFYLFGGVYFSQDKEFPTDYSKFVEGGSALTEPRWKAMKKLWQRLRDLGDEAQKTILPTGEGLGLVVKL